MEAVSINEFESPNIIPIGKFKGYDIVDIFDDEESYFQWLYDNVNLDSYPAFAEVLRNMLECGTPF